MSNSLGLCARKLTQMLDLEKPTELSLDDCKVMIKYLLANSHLSVKECRICYMRGLIDGIEKNI